VVKPIREAARSASRILPRRRGPRPRGRARLCFDSEILVERFIAGREVSVAVLEDRAIGAVEIAPRDGFYDYANKYTRGATEYFVPPRLSPERYRGVLAQAQRAHMALAVAARRAST